MRTTINDQMGWHVKMVMWILVSNRVMCAEEMTCGRRCVKEVLLETGATGWCLEVS